MMSNLKNFILISGMMSAAMLAQAQDVSTWDDWKMRTEVAVEAEKGKKPLYFIETTQPLYRAADRQNTLLMQVRASDEERFNDRRNTFNLGLGYRKLLADNSAMGGLKMFYDFESKYHMHRWSVGGDMSWNVFDLYANQYHGLGGWKHTSDGGSEKSLSGYDVDLAAQIPFMPWAKAHIMRYKWNKELAAENIIGSKLSLEGALSLNWTVEIGRNTDNVVANDNFVTLRYRWNGFVREYQTAHNNFISSNAFEMRDMRDFTLERMRRSNTIAAERTQP